MYRAFKISAGAIQRGELSKFNPLTNNHGYEMTESPLISQHELEIGTPARNSRPFGPNLDQRIAPPEFEIVYEGDKPVQMRIGPDVLHTKTVPYPIESVADFQSLAEARIDTLRQVNYSLDRCSMNELEKVTFSFEEMASFALAYDNQSLTENTFIDDALVMSIRELGQKVSGYTVAQMYHDFAAPYYQAVQKDGGTLAEDVTRALKIACVHLAESGLSAYDRIAVAEFAQGVEARVEMLWQERNDNMWNVWQDQATASEVPAKYSATFKTTFLHNMNNDLQGRNWDGDMALIYTNAYDAAYRAWEVARERGDEKTAEQYLRVEQLCISALNKIREDEEKAAETGARVREIKLFNDTPNQNNSNHDDGQSQEEQEEDGQSQDSQWPNFDDGPGGR